MVEDANRKGGKENVDISELIWAKREMELHHGNIPHPP